MLACALPTMRWLTEAQSGQGNRSSFAQDFAAWEGQRAAQVVGLWVGSGLVHLRLEKRLEQQAVVGL